MKLNALNPESVFGITSMSDMHVNHSDEWINMESMNLVSEDLVNLTLGDLFPADCVDLFGHVPDDWRISAGYYEFASLTTSESVSRMKCGHLGNSHVKRVMARSSRLHVRMSKNLSYRLK